MQRKPLPYTNNIDKLFAPFAQEKHAILLDSGKPLQQQGRFDIFTAYPQAHCWIDATGFYYQDTDNNDHSIKNLTEFKKILHSTARQSDDSIFTGGWLGFAHYELAAILQPQISANLTTRPIFWAGYYSWAVICDHQTQHCELVWQDNTSAALLAQIEKTLASTATFTEFRLSSTILSTMDFAHYKENFTKIQAYIQAGDCYQINYAQKFSASYIGDSFPAYQRLRNAVPSPFMAFINQGDEQILSISPEQFIQADQQQVQTKPIKGTAARGQDKAQDALEAELLLHSEKNRAENIMIVDLMRNDFNRFCQPNSVKTPHLCALESFSNVHHLVSTVTGELKEEHTIWDLFFASFPGGSITGAPKIRACQIIHELETAPRGMYCGSIFIASDNGHFQSNIAIRTLNCHEQTISAWAGGGITADSVCEDEYQECFNKINALLQVL